MILCHIETSNFKPKIRHKYAQKCVKPLKIISKLKIGQNSKNGPKNGSTCTPQVPFFFFFWKTRPPCTTCRFALYNNEGLLQNDLSFEIVSLTQLVHGSIQARLIRPTEKWRFWPLFSVILISFCSEKYFHGF